MLEIIYCYTSWHALAQNGELVGSLKVKVKVLLKIRFSQQRVGKGCLKK